MKAIILLAIAASISLVFMLVRRWRSIDPTRCYACGVPLAEGELGECQACWEERASW